MYINKLLKVKSIHFNLKWLLLSVYLPTLSFMLLKWTFGLNARPGPYVSEEKKYLILVCHNYL